MQLKLQPTELVAGYTTESVKHSRCNAKPAVTFPAAGYWKWWTRNQFPTKGFTTKCVRVVKIFMILAKYHYNTTYLFALKTRHRASTSTRWHFAFGAMLS